MVVVAFFVVVGLCVGWVVDIGLPVVIGIAALLLGLNLVVRSSLPFLLMLFMVGVGVTTAWRGDGVDLDGDMRDISLQIIAPNRAYVESYRDGDGVWREVRRSTYYGADSLLNLHIGDRVVSHNPPKEFPGGHYIFLTKRGTTFLESEPNWTHRLNDMACRKLERLDLSPDALSLVKSLLLGRRNTMDRSLTRSYYRGGLAHILALSGLHLGIIFMIFRALLRPLNIITKGHIVRHIVTVVLIWLYAMVAGMGTSIIRAATMLTILSLAHLLHRSYSSIGALLTAIMFMGLLNPSIFFEVGFWLTVIATVAIVEWGVPILQRIKWWSYRQSSSFVISELVRSFFSLFIVGTLCSIVLMPLLGYAFGYISLGGIIATPLVVLTTYMILIASILWVIIGFGWIAPPFHSFIEFMAFVQNSVARTIGSDSNLIYHFSLELWEVVAIYSLYLALTLLAHRKNLI